MSFKPKLTNAYSVENSNQFTHPDKPYPVKEALEDTLQEKFKNLIGKLKNYFTAVDKTAFEKEFLMMMDFFFKNVPQFKSITFTQFFPVDVSNSNEKYFDAYTENCEIASTSLIRDIYFSTEKNTDCKPDLEFNENGSFSGNIIKLLNEAPLSKEQQNICLEINNFFTDPDSNGDKILKEILGYDVIAVFRPDGAEVREIQFSS